MNADKFINGIRIAAYHGAIRGVLKQLSKPAGRKPREDVVDLGTWFNKLGRIGR